MNRMVSQSVATIIPTVSFGLWPRIIPSLEMTPGARSASADFCRDEPKKAPRHDRGAG